LGTDARDEVVGLIAEYRYLAESLASQHGCLHRNFQGNGHLFIFESADAALQFSLKLIERGTLAGPGRPGRHRPPACRGILAAISATPRVWKAETPGPAGP